MLVLFDIDGTLITSRRAGVDAMVRAGVDLYGSFTDAGVEYAGRLDPLIVEDLLSRNGHAPTPGAIAAFRAAYVGHLSTLLEEPGRARTLPGVDILVAALHADPEVTLGLLTGNFAESGRVKLEASGVGVDRFEICVWGDDSPQTPPHRDHLPAVAIERCRNEKDDALDAESVVLIGDTPHDIRCAHANGCVALGVATGMFAEADLADADLVAYDLSNTQEVLAWIKQPIRA